MTMSEWRAQRNRQALARLTKALPENFPGPALVHALNRPFTPPMPRLAVDSYWRAHPIRADRLARSMAARSGAPDGWTWRLHSSHADGLASSFRSPPAPYREPQFSRGPGYCCVCGQPVYRLGWHCDLWADGRPNRNAIWHSGCVAAWNLWTAPSDHVRHLKALQKRRCPVSGARLLKDAEVDHRVPLFKVWSDGERTWPALLAFWGVPNLQVINRSAHVEKCARESGDRALARNARPAASARI